MFQDNKILILGLARSGYEAAKYLAKRGNIVVLNDSCNKEKHNLEHIRELEDLGVKLIFGSHPDDLLDDSYQYLIKNPGIAIDHGYVLKAKKLGIEVINEAEMAYRLLPDDITLIGITGTNGKTTTTTLTYEILKENFGDRVHLAGNIGYPLCSILNNLKKNDIIVMEVSCQQSENFSKFKPHISLITNYSPAHIDFLKSYDNYKNVKAKLFRNQTADDVAIVNIENKDVIGVTKEIEACTKYFSSKNVINGSYIKNNQIYYYDEYIMDCNDVKIAGVHNLENCMAAIMVAKELGVSNDVIKKVISEFRGVEHRLEYFDTVLGRMFYKDTEATNIKCVQIALASFDKPIVLILGGLERGQNFNELTPYTENVKAIIAIGQCRERVVQFGEANNIETYSYEHLTDGFDKCVEVSNPGDIILLSPASASWDQYKECEERGAEFKKKVEALKNEN